MAAKAKRSQVAFLLAPGAGAPSSSEWMQAFARRLGSIGRVQCFDYSYQREGRRSPDRLPKLIEAHRTAYEELRGAHPGPVVFAGKSMGSRIGCHLANQLGVHDPSALVCFGYPLVGQNGAARDEVLLALETPILFVQGSKDALCPLVRLAEVRRRMKAQNELHVIDGGDHSLRVNSRSLSSQGRTQEEIDEEIVEVVRSFVATFAGAGH